MHLLERAGDFVNEDIWHRVVQLVTNNESMQQYAARNMVALLRRGASHEVSDCEGSEESRQGMVESF
jgi:AP-2 complex subunit alpha